MFQFTVFKENEHAIVLAASREDAISALGWPPEQCEILNKVARKAMVISRSDSKPDTYASKQAGGLSVVHHEQDKY